jgi:hypothetical protein
MVSEALTTTIAACDSSAKLRREDNLPGEWIISYAPVAYQVAL